MPRSSASNLKVYGSQRLHPYAQKLPIEPASELVPLRAAIHPVLRRSLRTTKNKYRSTTDSLNDEGVYDPDVPIPSIESDDYPEPYVTVYNEIMQSPHSPVPSSRSVSVVSSTTEDYLVAANSDEQHSRNPDESLYDRQEPVAVDPVKYIVIDILGGNNNRDVMEAIQYCRFCFDQDDKRQDRYITDCVQTSGRVYDRVIRCEVKRMIPWVGDDVPRDKFPQVFDILTGDVRRRLLYDDYRDCNARIRGHLEVTERELQINYKGIRFP